MFLVLNFAISCVCWPAEAWKKNETLETVAHTCKQCIKDAYTTFLFRNSDSFTFKN